ncbi:MAG: hypothetical protein OXD01_03050, partial [Gammaproteobacteria bacterium]|nr:hypothetical protein [Gammaproteobacteria bacterium]
LESVLVEIVAVSGKNCLNIVQFFRVITSCGELSTPRYSRYFAYCRFFGLSDTEEILRQCGLSSPPRDRVLT